MVPVKAIGSRALLDFPDQINFSGAPVKVRIINKDLSISNPWNEDIILSAFVRQCNFPSEMKPPL